MEFGPFFLGDMPVNPVAIEVESADDLSVFDQAEAVLYSPSGETTGMVAATYEDGVVSMVWPEGFELDEAGLWGLNVKLAGLDGELALGVINFVVQDQTTGWHTLTSARQQWNTDLSDAALFELLEIARAQCEAYAPAVESVPLNYKRAQLVQARNLHNAQAANPASGDFGDTFSLSTRPLDWHVKNLLRPTKGVPLVG